MKVENRDLDVNEINKISVIAPQATINWIQDYHVVRKEKVKLPKELKDIVECPNPSCITNKEREPVKSIFIVKNTNPVELVCRYCERETSIESLY